jgi:polyhydroxyalkanoate synthesis regulator phasin
MKPTLRDASRAEFLVRGNRGTADEIQAGSLQRMADSLETIAKDKSELEATCARLEAAVIFWRNQARQCGRSHAALRGVITRLKRQIAELKQEAEA